MHEIHEVAGHRASAKQLLKGRLAALEAERSSALPAGLTGPWAIGVLLGLGGLAASLLWRRRPWT